MTKKNEIKNGTLSYMMVGNDIRDRSQDTIKAPSRPLGHQDGQSLNLQYTYSLYIGFALGIMYIFLGDHGSKTKRVWLISTLTETKSSHYLAEAPSLSLCKKSNLRLLGDHRDKHINASSYVK